MAMLIQRMAAGLTRWSTRYVPDAFVIALVLTALVVVVAFAVTPVTPLKMLESWGGGMWSLHEFASQMCLILLAGYVLALAPPIKRALDRLAAIPTTPRGAIALTA